MNSALNNVIDDIVADFTCDAAKTVSYKQQFLCNAPINQIERNQLINMLMDIIYRDFYCGISSVVNGQQDEMTFLQLLKKSVQPQQTISKGWRLQEQEGNGGVYVQKDNRIIYAEAGNYTIDYDEVHQNRSGYVNVVVNPPPNNPGEYFYYVKGISPISGNVPIIRFYFNVKPSGAALLISSLCNHFNIFEVPFTFKCCAKPSYYNRRDTAVLYIDYNLFPVSIQLLEKVIAEVKGFLNSEVPLFTYKITNGFSFAENPQANLSFGQSRCRVIAEGITDSIVTGAEKETYTKNILECFKREGFILDKLFLNPKSNMQYNFSLGGFKHG